VETLITYLSRLQQPEEEDGDLCSTKRAEGFEKQMPAFSWAAGNTLKGRDLYEKLNSLGPVQGNEGMGPF
jgi:hypothetical protein